MSTTFENASFNRLPTRARKNPAALQFDVCFTPERPTAVFLYEKYTDDEAIATHRATPHFADYDATTKDWIVDKQATIWTVAE